MKKRAVHTILFYLLLVLIPVQLNYYFWPDFSYVQGIRIDHLSPTLYATTLLATGVLLSWFSSQSKQTIPKINRPIILFCALLIVNIVCSRIPLLSAVKIIPLLLYCLLGWYVYTTKPDRNVVVGCLLIAAIWSCLLAWMQFANQSSIGGVFWWLGERTFDRSTPGIATALVHNQLVLRPYATFPHPNVLAGFLVALLPLVLNYSTGWFFRLKIPASIFMIATIGITYSRSAWIVSIIILIWFALRNRMKKISLTTILVTILLIAFLLPLSFERFSNLATVDTQSVTRRAEQIPIALNMLLKHPVTGVGYANNIPMVPSYISISSYQDVQPTHNIYLLYAAEWGSIGLAYAAYLIVALRKKMHPSRWGMFHLSLASLLALGLFDHYPYTSHHILLLIAVLGGYALSLKNETTS